MSSSMYWDGHELLTRNAMFNFAIGGRGTGKTFFAKRSRIKHFLKTGKQFIYLRRYKPEFEDRSLFFEDVAQEFPSHEFKVEGMKGYVRKQTDEEKKPKWRLMCMFVTLANALTKKSVPYPDVDMIVFDEFIIDKGHIHYLTNEVKAFYDFYNTVDRFQDRVKVLFLANSVSVVNPYFIAFHLKPRKETRFILAHKGYMCCELIDSSRFQAHVDETRFGKMIKGTSYYDYAVGNVFNDDNDLFIAKKPPEAIFFYAIKFDERTIGVWVDYSEGNYYITKKAPKNSVCYALTKRDMEPNLLMIEKSNIMLKCLRKLYMQGSVFFDSVQTREFFNNVLDYLNLR